MKERSGPGMPTVSTAGEEGGAPALAEPVFGGFDSDGEAPLTGLPEKAEEQTHRQKKADTKMADVRRGHFIIGIPL
jgi:hypothetical protein